MDADVVVVGAGVVGCLVAAEVLARAPGAGVVVVERCVVGGGASRLSAGLHFPRGASERVRAMTAYSHRYYEALRRSDPAVPIHPVDMTVVGGPDSEPEVRAHYLAEAGLSEAGVAGAPVTLPAGSRAWAATGAHYADVGAFTQHLAARLRPRLRLWEGTAVAAVEPGGVVRLANGTKVTADRVVLAPGPWVADPAWRDLLDPLGIRVKKVVALHVDRVPAAGDRVVVFHDEDAFLLPLVARGHWLFSYTSPDWDVSPGAFGGGLSEVDLDRGRDILDRYAHDFARVTFSGRMFCDAYSLDRTPVVRPVTDDGRVLFAGAANGSGYRLGPAIAAEAADLLGLIDKESS